MQASMLQLGRGPSHSISCIKQSTLWARSFRQVEKSSTQAKITPLSGTTLQAVRDARSCRIQSHRSLGPLRLRSAYNPTPYRVNDDSPAANDSNSFHPRSPLGCWLAYMYFNLESGRMLIFQRTSAEPLWLAHRTPGVRSNTG